MSLARFNLYRLSYRHLWITRNDPSKARGGRWAWWLEVFALFGFLFWNGRVLVGCGSWQTGLMYLLVSNMVPSPLHVQVALSRHFRWPLGFPLTVFPRSYFPTTRALLQISAQLSPSHIGSFALRPT